jgi:hypothetical protein
MSKQYMMQKLDQKFKVKIKLQRDDGSIVIVEAPLPEQFGFTVGSEFSAPFDAATLGGVLQKFKVPGAMNVGKRVGVTTTKFYSNPQPTEISFDLEFHAEYSARYEVVEPVVALMCMSLGDALTFDDALSTIEGVREQIAALLPGAGESDSNEEGDTSNASESTIVTDSFKESADGAMALLGLIKGPVTATIQFGVLYALDNAWISSVTPQFSNVVDADGFPLSATCSVTAILQRDPVVNDVNRFFNATSGVR